VTRAGRRVYVPSFAARSAPFGSVRFHSAPFAARRVITIDHERTYRGAPATGLLIVGDAPVIVLMRGGASAFHVCDLLIIRNPSVDVLVRVTRRRRRLGFDAVD